MIRRPPRSTLDRSSAASDVYKRQVPDLAFLVTGHIGVVAGEPALGVTQQHDRVHLCDVAGPAPVSYTHLRAHETVLDLVCRLLLEKKKANARSRMRLKISPYTKR